MVGFPPQIASRRRTRAKAHLLIADRMYLPPNVSFLGGEFYRIGGEINEFFLYPGPSPLHLEVTGS